VTIVDAPFFADDKREGAEKASRGLSTFKLHASLDPGKKRERHARVMIPMKMTSTRVTRISKRRELTTCRTHASTQIRVHGA
jgi:hypothetical protein